MGVRKMKEKCKDAARMRREKERAEFVELSKLLPLPSSTTSQLDKASIIRLTSSYLRMRSAFPQGLGVNWGINLRDKRCEHYSDFLRQPTLSQMYHEQQQNQMQHHQMQQVREMGSLILQTLDGFVFALHSDGKIMYISETASVHLGLPQIDLTGSSIFEYVHPSDHNDIYDILALSDSDIRQIDSNLAQVHQPSKKDSTMDSYELGRSFCMRMKCILPKRNAGLVNSGYKAIHCNGYLKVRCQQHNYTNQNTDESTMTIAGGGPGSYNDMSNTKSNNHHHNHQSSIATSQSWQAYALVAVGHSLLPTASTEVKLSGNSFMFRASLDLKLYYIETPVSKLLGYDQSEMLGLSLYQFVHIEDVANMEVSHRSLLAKGQVVTKYYRMMRKDGGSIWLQSYATLVNNPRSIPRPQHIVSVCFVLGDNPTDLSCAINSQLNNQQQENSIQVTESHDYTGNENDDFNDAPSAANSNINETSPMVMNQQRSVILSRRSSNRKISNMKQRARRASKEITGAPKVIVPMSSKHSLSCHSSDYRITPPPINETIGNNGCYVTLGSIRRASDDSCSVVSSVASTNISTLSQCGRTDFVAYMPIECTPTDSEQQQIISTPSNLFQVDQQIATSYTLPLDSHQTTTTTTTPSISRHYEDHHYQYNLQTPSYLTSEQQLQPTWPISKNQREFCSFGQNDHQYNHHPYEATVTNSIGYRSYNREQNFGDVSDNSLHYGTDIGGVASTCMNNGQDRSAFQYQISNGYSV